MTTDKAAKIPVSGAAGSGTVGGYVPLWRRILRRPAVVTGPKLTGEFVRNGVCAGCGPWCKDHGWKAPEPTGNPEADLAAAKAFAARVRNYLDGPR